MHLAHWSKHRLGLGGWVGANALRAHSAWLYVWNHSHLAFYYYFYPFWGHYICGLFKPLRVLIRVLATQLGFSGTGSQVPDDPTIHPYFESYFFLVSGFPGRLFLGGLLNPDAADKDLMHCIHGYYSSGEAVQVSGRRVPGRAGQGWAGLGWATALGVSMVLHPSAASYALI